MGDFYIRKIRLPNGKEIEIVYYTNQPEQKCSHEPIEVCIECKRSMVYPVTWREVGDMWELELRCPDCGLRRTGTFADEDVQCYDNKLNRGVDQLIDDLQWMTKVNMESYVESFTRALHDDLIVPEDF